MATKKAVEGRADTATAGLSLLDRIIQEGKMAIEPSQNEYAKKLLGQFATQILDEGMQAAPDKGVIAMINERVAEIDKILSEQLNVIMHDPDFQALEGSWRGFHDMVYGTETSPRLKLRLLNVSKKELLKDLENAVDHDMSVLFKKVYEEEYGTFGGHPYSVLIGDYYFGRHPQDMALLQRLSKVAAAAHAPFISAAASSLFDMGSFTDFSVPRDLSKVSSRPNWPPGVVFVNLKIRATSRWYCHATPHVCPTAPKTCPSRISTLKRTSTARTIPSTCGPTPLTSWVCASPTLLPSTTGPRRSEGSKAAARSRA